MCLLKLQDLLIAARTCILISNRLLHFANFSGLNHCTVPDFLNLTADSIRCHKCILLFDSGLILQEKFFYLLEPKFWNIVKRFDHLLGVLFADWWCHWSRRLTGYHAESPVTWPARSCDDHDIISRWKRPLGGGRNIWRYFKVWFRGVTIL